MKILHIVPTYLPAYRYGGPIEAVHSLNKWLVKSGAEVTVYTTNVNGPENLDVAVGQPVMIDGVKVIYFPTNFLRSWYYSSAMRRALKETVKNFDLIHISSVFLFASTLGACYAKKFNKPYIISPHGSLMTATLKKKALKKKIYINLLEKRNLRGAAAIHFTTELEKREYIAAGLPLREALVLPLGLDTSKFPVDFPRGHFRKKHGISDEKKIILFLSRLSWKKGLDILIPAFADVAKKEDTVLVLAGGDDEGYSKNIKAQISKFKIEERVIFTGMILEGDKFAAYRDADIFVLPSYAENFAIVVLEAGAMGLPVVVTPGVGLSAAVAESGAGLVVEGTVQKLSEGLLNLLQNPEKASEMGEGGRRMVAEKFSWERIARDFVLEYDAIINNRALKQG